MSRADNITSSTSTPTTTPTVDKVNMDRPSPQPVCSLAEQHPRPTGVHAGVDAVHDGPDRPSTPAPTGLSPLPVEARPEAGRPRRPGLSRAATYGRSGNLDILDVGTDEVHDGPARHSSAYVGPGQVDGDLTVPTTAPQPDPFERPGTPVLGTASRRPVLSRGATYDRPGTPVAGQSTTPARDLTQLSRQAHHPPPRHDSSAESSAALASNSSIADLERETSLVSGAELLERPNEYSSSSTTTPTSLVVAASILPTQWEFLDSGIFAIDPQITALIRDRSKYNRDEKKRVIGLNKYVKTVACGHMFGNNFLGEYFNDIDNEGFYKNKCPVCNIELYRRIKPTIGLAIFETIVPMASVPVASTPEVPANDIPTPEMLDSHEPDVLGSQAADQDGSPNRRFETPSEDQWLRGSEEIPYLRPSSRRGRREPDVAHEHNALHERNAIQTQEWDHSNLDIEGQSLHGSEDLAHSRPFFRREEREPEVVQKQESDRGRSQHRSFDSNPEDDLALDRRSSNEPRPRSLSRTRAAFGNIIAFSRNVLGATVAQLRVEPAGFKSKASNVIKDIRNLGSCLQRGSQVDHYADYAADMV